jgi:hypothetical protein
MQRLSHEELFANNQRQLDEALGPDNRYFACQHFGREDLTDEELVLYYILHGGAIGHRDRMEHNPPPKPSTNGASEQPVPTEH